MIETVCAGVNVYMVCAPVQGVKLTEKDIVLPKEYKDWKIEKAIYSPQEDKIYVQISYSNLRKVITL